MSEALLYALPERSVLACSGEDRVQWLDGMVSNDVATSGAGAVLQALVLTREGRIVSDPWVLVHEDALWLELEAAALQKTRAHLEKFIIADDVALEDAGARLARFSLDGPGAGEALRAAGAEALPEAGAHVSALVAGHRLTLAGYGFAGAPAFQIFADAGAREALQDALCKLPGVAPGDAGRFECRRIEAGTPRFGFELDESVLPAEARLEAAVSESKGCYTGQEVVARMRSRGRVGHLLVGLRFAGERLPAAGASLALSGEDGAAGPGPVVGEVTSAVLSPECGAIGLGFVRAQHAEAGVLLDVAEAGAGVRTTVTALPHRKTT